MARAPCTAFAGVMLLPLLATLALTASPAVVAQGQSGDAASHRTRKLAFERDDVSRARYHSSLDAATNVLSCWLLRPLPADCPAPPQQPDYTVQLNSLLGGQVVQPPSPFNVTVWKGEIAK